MGICKERFELTTTLTFTANICQNWQKIPDVFSDFHRAAEQCFQLIVPEGRLTWRQECSCAGPNPALAFWLAWQLPCRYEWGPRLWYGIVHERLVSLRTVLSSKRNIFYQHFLVTHSTHILCKWEAIGNKDDKGAAHAPCNSQVTVRLFNDRKLLNVTRLPMQGNASSLHLDFFFEEHIKGCKQNFMFVLWYLNYSTSAVFDITVLPWKINCSCVRLGTMMKQVAQHYSEEVYGKTALDILQMPQIWDNV